MELNLAILAAIFAGQLIARKTRPDIYRGGFFGLALLIAAIVLVFGNAGYLSWQQYYIWENSNLGKLLLPPYQNFDYFVFYARYKFFNPYLLSLFIGFLFLWAAKYFNKKYGENFFEPIEPYLLAVSIFLIGHPGWLFYLIILLSVFASINALITGYHLRLLKHKESPRISLFYLWLPAAISTILISRWLAEFPWWKILKF